MFICWVYCYITHPESFYCFRYCCYRCCCYCLLLLDKKNISYHRYLSILSVNDIITINVSTINLHNEFVFGLDNVKYGFCRTETMLPTIICSFDYAFLTMVLRKAIDPSTDSSLSIPWCVVPLWHICVHLPWAIKLRSPSMHSYTSHLLIDGVIDKLTYQNTYSIINEVTYS